MALTTGEALLTSGASEWLCSAAASCLVSETALAEEPPKRAPPRIAPDSTSSTLVPRLSIRSSTALEEPLPTAIRMITEATPIVMPRIVRPERSLLATIPPQAMRSVSMPIMAGPRRGAARCADFRWCVEGGGSCTPSRRRSSTHLPVAEAHDALGLGGDVGLVGDQHDGAPFEVEVREDREHVLGGVRVEVAGRLVGEDQRGVGDDRAGDGDALLLAAGELGGEVVQRGWPCRRRPARARRGGGARRGAGRRRRAAVRRWRARGCAPRG